MNPKSALLAFALFFACLTLAAQEKIVGFTGDTTASAARSYTFVSTARFDAIAGAVIGGFYAEFQLTPSFQFGQS